MRYTIAPSASRSRAASSTPAVSRSWTSPLPPSGSRLMRPRTERGRSAPFVVAPFDSAPFEPAVFADAPFEGAWAPLVDSRPSAGSMVGFVARSERLGVGEGRPRDGRVGLVTGGVYDDISCLGHR